MTKQTKSIISITIAAMVFILMAIFCIKNNCVAMGQTAPSSNNTTITDDKDEYTTKYDDTTTEKTTSIVPTQSQSQTQIKDEKQKETINNTKQKQDVIEKAVTEKINESKTTKCAEYSIRAKTITPSSLENDVFNKVNQYRTENGSGSLKWDETLHAIAEIRAEECAIKFSHERPDGTKFKQLIIDAHYDTERAAENLYNFTISGTNADVIIESFKNSPGHNASMLNSDFSKAGFAYYEDSNSGECYFVQIFAK